MQTEKRVPPEETPTVKGWANFANNTKENIKCRQQWDGDDASFCHWEADSKQDILDWFEELGLNKLMTIELHEQWRFTSFYDQSYREVEYKEY